MPHRCIIHVYNPDTSQEIFKRNPVPIDCTSHPLVGTSMVYLPPPIFKLGCCINAYCSNFQLRVYFFFFFNQTFFCRST